MGINMVKSMWNIFIKIIGLLKWFFIVIKIKILNGGMFIKKKFIVIIMYKF